jgi:hypothetical protein
MLELVVLGKIPGTTIQIDIVSILLFVAVIMTALTCYYLFRKSVSRAYAASLKLSQ